MKITNRIDDRAPAVELPPGELQQAIDQALLARLELDRLEELRQQAGQLNALRAQQARQQRLAAARHHLGEVTEETKALLADLPPEVAAWLEKVMLIARLIVEARAELDKLQKVISSSGYRLVDACNAVNAAGVDPANYADYDPASPTKAGPLLADPFDLLAKAGFNNPRLVLSLAILVLDNPELREVAALLQPPRGQRWYSGVKYFF